jgi:hypothetical protein
MATTQPTAVPPRPTGQPPQGRPSTSSDSEEEELPPEILDRQQRIGLVETKRRDYFNLF